MITLCLLAAVALSQDAVAGAPPAAPPTEQVAPAEPFDLLPVQNEPVAAPTARPSANVLPDSVAPEPTATRPDPTPAPVATATPEPVVHTAPGLVTVPVAPHPRSRLDPALRRLMPDVPWRGFRWALLFGFLTVVIVAIDAVLARIGRPLQPRGVLPAFVGTARALSRTLALVFGVGVLTALVPHALAPALPVLLLALTVALGWSVHEVLPDVAAGVVLLVERRVRPRRWLEVEGYAGVVQTMGLRATWLQDGHGRLVSVPNRSLLGRPIAADPSRWPAIEVHVRHQGPCKEVRKRVYQTALLLPWVAPEGEVTVLPDGEMGHWRVRVRLLEARFAEDFRAGLQELLRAPVEEP